MTETARRDGETERRQDRETESTERPDGETKTTGTDVRASTGATSSHGGRRDETIERDGRAGTRRSAGATRRRDGFSSLASIDWKSFGLNVKSGAIDEDGDAVLEWENLPPLVQISHYYPKVTYDAKSVDEEAYGEMIKQLRNILVTGSYYYGIPRLLDPTTVPDSKRYILVEIAESRGQIVTFAIDVTNVYVVGYLVDNQRYFFNEAQANAPDLLFTNATGTSPDRRSSNYNALESRAGVTRENIRGRVADNVNSFVIADLYLMLFVCNNNPTATTTASSTSTSFDVSHLQLVTQQQQQQPNLLGVGGADDQPCRHSVEPRTRIMGRNGMCVDVDKFIYSENNPIVLYPCKTSDFKNQLWTLGENGRIRSLEKCLAVSGTTPGSSVVIHECETLDDTAIRWAMSYYGELVNAHSGLALTAKDGTSSSNLTLEKTDSSSFQTWKATNKLTPVDVYIHGKNNQCIYYNGGSGVYTETCSKGKQQWRLYPDGTIRPKDWLDGCIEIASLSSAENVIYIKAGDCSGSPELHKWFFSHDGAMAG
ncbi:hypothetical protein Syun_015396 [Stephania yunnanensis]|uniref:Ribosome-inactivating protein n=1 Tax=Stephania yunnanensis TaxID=152371 RepID=A0AAP0JM57_9MAGN